MNKLIYGKSDRDKIVGMGIKDGRMIMYCADGDKTQIKTAPFKPYMLLKNHDYDGSTHKLNGGHYKFLKEFDSKGEMWRQKRSFDYEGVDYWRSYNDDESFMLRSGDTMYKGMTMDKVSVLSFDIETTGVKIDSNSYVLIITNTFRDRAGNISRRLFSFDQYDHPKDMLAAWAKYVREVDPDIVCGHNIFSFDIPYLLQVCSNYNTNLTLGRDGSKLKQDNYTRKFRKDGSQQYEYQDCHIFGRQLIDTYFLSLKYDVGRKYPNYRLKDIVQFEGMDKEDRQYWDFSANKEPWNNKQQWKLFKQYAEEDADDALKLFDLMAPQYFYYAQSIPKTFQQIINSATGSQVNSFMCRAYLQDGYGLPKASEKVPFEGAISIGNPGIYQEVYKIDVASLYPSIMMTYKVSDLNKDTRNVFLSAVTYFTEERLKNKAKAEESGNRYYKDMEQGQKIMINSFYGFMGAPGLNFNYPEGAAEVTRLGREILTNAINWAEENEFPLVNADTDSISFISNGVDMQTCLKQVNELSGQGITWERDGGRKVDGKKTGIYDAVIVVKAKNYLLCADGKLTYKGSALKATMKEKALAAFLKETLALLLKNDIQGAEKLYLDSVESIKYLQDISEWCSKKTVTSSVLNPKRSTEQRILDAIGDKPVQEGDKIRVFFKSDTEVCLEENFDGTYDSDRMYDKLFKTVKVLAPVLDISKFPNYKLKRNKKLLEEI